jgi:hypothetical protein
MSTNEAMANSIVDAVDEVSPAAEEALENIEANDEADPTPLVVDTEVTPDRMTPRDISEWWTQTGNSVISGSDAIGTTLTPGATYRASYGVATVSPDIMPTIDNLNVREVEAVSELEPVAVSDSLPEIVEVNQPQLEGQVYGPITIEEKTKKEEEEYKKKYKEEIERKKERDRRILIRNKRLSLHCHEQYFITPNDLMIIPRENRRDNFKPYFIKTDTQRSGKIVNLAKYSTSCDTTGHQTNILSNIVMFDKNMNPLTVNFSPYTNERSDKRCRRIDIRTTELARYYNKMRQKKWIVVDKLALVSSKGRNFRIRNRNGITIQEALELKKKIIAYFDKGEAFINYLKFLMGQIYDEENFEIVYEFNFSECDTENKFYLFFQFPNLTITNSIELTHNIDNLVTRLFGKHTIDSSRPNLMKFTKLMEGLRTKFSPEDMFYGYSHSHLSTHVLNWDTFCMGEEHFMNSVENGWCNAIDELDFETLLVAMLDHISWESLEGGPYIKMESIGNSEDGIIRIDNSRYLCAYQSDLLEDLMKYISEDIRFKKLLDAFTLKIEKGKEATYSFDRKLFITRFIEELDQDTIYAFHQANEISPYEYVPADDTFRRTDFEIVRANSWIELYKAAREKIYKFPIVYMNGKYIKPSLTDINAPIVPVKRSLPTIHPDVILYIAKIIHYYLLNELKNVKK